MKPSARDAQFADAYYIKLGSGGKWEKDSIANGYLRLGWKHQSLQDINGGKWDAIGVQLRSNQTRGVATTDLNRLREISQSTVKDVWITFSGAKMWWARLQGPVREDAISKYRETVDGWHDTSVEGRLLVVNELPGKLAMLQGFRGTACRVKERDLLHRVLSGARSALAVAISSHREALASELERAIKGLHWKDYETLVDLVFRHAGWERVSVAGQHEKGYDLELREPITGDRYMVQIKSKANRAALDRTVAQFSPEDYRRVFFVVHTPSGDLEAATDLPEHCQLVDPRQLAELALQAGLVPWLESKAA
jgi:hypothetical protein